MRHALAGIAWLTLLGLLAWVITSIPVCDRPLKYVSANQAKACMERP